MKNTRTKLTAAAAVTIASAMMFSGCTGGKDANTGKGKTLKCYFPSDKQQDLAKVNEKLNEMLKDKTDFSVNINFIDTTAYEERMNMNMASKDAFDIAWVGYMNTMENCAQKGGIAALDELLKETPDLLESIPDYAWEQSKLDGQIYAVPNLQILADQKGVIVRKDLAEKYGLKAEDIKKTTDIEPFLEKIKRNEPNVIPFDPAYGVNSFWDYDSKTNYSAEALVLCEKDENGKLVKDANGNPVAKFGQDLGDTYGKAKKLHEWYEKGYIRKDIATVVDTAADYKAGKYASFVSSIKPGLESELQARHGMEWTVYPVTKAFLGNLQAQSTMLAVGKNSKYPTDAIKFIELLNTDKDIYNLVCFGIEDVHYKKTGENRIELIENSGYCPSASWKFGNQFNAYLLPGQPDDVWEKTKEMNDNAEKTELDGFSFDKTNVKNIVTKLNNVVSEYKTMRQGVADPDAYWNEYKTKLYESGLQDYIDEYQKQVNEFMASKK